MYHLKTFKHYIYYKVKQLNGMRVCIETKNLLSKPDNSLFNFNDGKAI